ncbi:MAG: dephospho-CoA kinase [Bacteroidales bacterium]|nr:dephospho-CoA kinase [Bacteroidales bacterium]
MKKIGITGYIGSGKTTACMIFEHLGIPVYYSDKQAKEAYKQAEIQEQIVQIAGEPVYEHGVLNTSALADIIFRQPEKLALVNGIIHPYVWNHFLQWCEQQESAYVLFESAILFQTGWHSRFEDVILIRTPMEELYNRIQFRNHWTIEQISRRLQQQNISSDAVETCKYIVDNAEADLMLPQILQIYNEILSE